MRLKNTTNLPDRFVRRCAAWVCRQLGITVKQIGLLKLRNRSDGLTSGRHHFHGHIVASLGSLRFKPAADGGRPFDAEWRRDGESWVLAGPPDVLARRQAENLVGILGHEFAHRLQHLEMVPRGKRRSGSTTFGGTERNTRWHERRVVEAFKKDRDALLAKWLISTERLPKSAPTAQELFAKAKADLARWQRKLELAQTRIRKLWVACYPATRARLMKTTPLPAQKDRFAKAEANFARGRRNLRLAQTKVRKLKAKVWRYVKVARGAEGSVDQ